jgi:hypothetical protein
MIGFLHQMQRRRLPKAFDDGLEQLQFGERIAETAEGCGYRRDA